MAEELLENIAKYVVNPPPFSQEAYETARYCLADALGCGILALQYSACTKLLGPVIPGITVADGCHVPGTKYVLDPVTAAFNLGTMIRWLDFNDTWLAAEWGHPSDNIGGLLPVSEYMSRKNGDVHKHPLVVKDLLAFIIMAYEIQGTLALLNSFNKVGFDHVIFVKLATAAVTARMLGANYEQIVDVLSQACIDLGPLRTYRHAPNVGSRKSWAAGDSTSRGVWLALMTMRGERGYATPLSAPKWGLYDVLFKGETFKIQRPLGCYVMENILFKIAFPAEFHAQTAVEAAFHLHPFVKGRWNEIKTIDVRTHESAIRIIDKKGPLNNPADRDHCLQYMIAIGLLKGTLTADDYEDEAAKDPLIDLLREKMRVVEEPSFSLDYHDPQKRSISNALTIHFTDGTATAPVIVEYPLGHRRRRGEAIPQLLKKLRDNLLTLYPQDQADHLVDLFRTKEKLNTMPIQEFIQSFQSL